MSWEKRGAKYILFCMAACLQIVMTIGVNRGDQRLGQ